MTAPFYVAPEQVMKDRADYARKGIARGRSLVAVSCNEGILLIAENPSRLLRKISRRAASPTCTHRSWAMSSHTR